jgi:hypothetical protein
MISFVLIFFFAAFIPYIDLQHQKESSLSDNIIKSLTELDRLTLQQENISKSIQNLFDAPTLAAISDYRRLDDYFRRLELLQSEAIASSSNLSINQLETIVPTFLKCNKKFHVNITDWVLCNAKDVADSTNQKIMLRYQPMGHQISPLVKLATENLKTFNLIALPLISDNTSEITSNLPEGIKPDSLKQTISNSLGLMKTWERNVESVQEFVSYKESAESLAWTLLSNPSNFRLTYTDSHREDFNNILNLLNQSKNEIEKKIESLSEKFDEVEFPVLGKIPVGLVNAVMVFPAAIGAGSLICSYYLSQTISRRLHLHKKLKDQFDPNLYSVWVDPQDKRFRFGRLMLFISMPLLMLFVVKYLVYSIPIKQESIFGIAENTILNVSFFMGLILILLGAIKIVKKIYEYNPTPPNPQPKFRGAP